MGELLGVDGGLTGIILSQAICGRGQNVLILNTDAYAHVVRPLLFRLPAETAQRVAEKALRRQMPWKAMSLGFRVRDRRLHSSLCGLPLSNPVGLAAGFDKDCEMIPSLASLGFGYLTVGTVTVHPRAGNPKPRLFRNAGESSLSNAMGFPSKGLAPAARQLELYRTAGGRTPVVVSVSGVTVEEIVRCHRRLEALADAVEINISSPNTAGLRLFHEPDALAQLLGAVNEARHRPLIVKLPPYPGPDVPSDEFERSRDLLMALVRVCKRQGVDGLTVANTRPTPDSRLAVGSGGLSGRPVFSRMVEMVRDVRSEVGEGMTINACGGVFTGEDALAAILAGASTVQVYTAFVYRGPTVAREINKEILAALSRRSTAAP